MITGRKHASRPVRAQPVLAIERVLDRKHLPRQTRPPFPLGDPRATLTYSGTAAIYQAFRALGVKPGSAVLCPAYNCGHEIEPLVRLGLRVECYRVTRDLTLDLDDVKKRLRNGARALLVTHYFGFSQPLAELRELCDEYGAFLVEDCAHAFLSDNVERTLGRMGDVAIYSMRKTLPIPNGGAIVFNRPSLTMDGALHAPPSMTTWMKSLELTTKSVMDSFAAGHAPADLLWLLLLLPLFASSRALRSVHPRASVACYNPDDDDYRFDIDIVSWDISPLSMHLLERVDWDSCVARRRRNYQRLLDILGRTNDSRQRSRLLLPSLPERTCPLYLPLWVEKPLDLYDKLAKERIFAEVLWQEEHPAVDWEAFPEARELKRHVFALPVHQDVDDEQIDRVAAALERVNR